MVLPPNKMQKTVDTPKNFFIYGQTMHGKSYLAGEFPNPLFLDTDGNAKANPYPSIELRNTIDRRGKITKSVIDQIDEIVIALQTTQHTYETIVIDVIDDVVTMMDQSIAQDFNKRTCGEVDYGKATGVLNNVVQQMAIDFKALPLNVIYISRISSYEENGVAREEPSLKEKFVNMINGNCDYKIQAKKVGKNYIRVVKDKRKNYQKDTIGDERILKILETVTGAFDRSQKTDAKKQEAIVRRMQQEEEEVLTGDVETVADPEITAVSEEKAEVTKPTESNKPTEKVDAPEETKVDTTVPYPKTKPEVTKVDGMPVTTRKRPKLK